MKTQTLVTLQKALLALKSNMGEVDTLECIIALEQASPVFTDFEPVELDKLQKYAGGTTGALIIRCLRAGAEDSYKWAQKLAPKLYPKGEDLQRGQDLYTDCYLAFAEWVVAWNRKSIRTVA